MTRKRFVKLVMAGGLQDKREAVALAQYMHRKGISYSWSYEIYSVLCEYIAELYMLGDDLLEGHLSGVGHTSEVKDDG